MNSLAQYPVVVVSDLFRRKSRIRIAARRRCVPITDQDDIQAVAERCLSSGVDAEICGHSGDDDGVHVTNLEEVRQAGVEEAVSRRLPEPQISWLYSEPGTQLPTRLIRLERAASRAGLLGKDHRHMPIAGRLGQNCDPIRQLITLPDHGYERFLHVDDQERQAHRISQSPNWTAMRAATSLHPAWTIASIGEAVSWSAGPHSGGERPASHRHCSCFRFCSVGH